MVASEEGLKTTIAPPNDVRRLPVGTAYLEHLAVTIRLIGRVATDDHPIADA